MPKRPSAMELFHLEFDFCFLCFRSAAESGAGWWKLECQHIERRSQAKRDEAYRDRRCNLLMACTICHAGRLATMEHARQLALRHFSDPFAYDSIEALVADWLPIRAGGGGPNRVLPAEVRKFVKRLLVLRVDIVGNVVGKRRYQHVRDRYELWQSGNEPNVSPPDQSTILALNDGSAPERPG